MKIELKSPRYSSPVEVLPSEKGKEFTFFGLVLAMTPSPLLPASVSVHTDDTLTPSYSGPWINNHVFAGASLLVSTGVYLLLGKCGHLQDRANKVLSVCWGNPKGTGHQAILWPIPVMIRVSSCREEGNYPSVVHISLPGPFHISRPKKECLLISSS